MMPASIVSPLAPYRVASVSYLNARPLIFGLESDPAVSLSLDVPSKLVDHLRAGEADVALLPVIDYQRLEGLTIIPAGGIGSDGPTLTEIARQVHLSPFHFHRRFAELLGLTPKHYLLECQITQAKQELLARKKELAQIATDCGFAHQSHFTSRFKQATGLTPTRWRRLASGETRRN